LPPIPGADFGFAGFKPFGFARHHQILVLISSHWRGQGSPAGGPFIEILNQSPLDYLIEALHHDYLGSIKY